MVLRVAGNAATRWRIALMTADKPGVRHVGVASQGGIKHSTVRRLAVGPDSATEQLQNGIANAFLWSVLGR